MRALVKLMAAMAAAGVCGSAQAGATVFANDKDLAHKGAGSTVLPGPLDVAKTPSPGGPVPIPYPNIGHGQEGKKSPKVTETKTPLQNKSTYMKTTGDEAGTQKGVVSSKNMDKAGFKAGASKVKVEGKNVARRLDVPMHNHKGPDTGTGAKQPDVLLTPIDTPPSVTGVAAAAPTPSQTGAITVMGSMPSAPAGGGATETDAASGAFKPGAAARQPGIRVMLTPATQRQTPKSDFASVMQRGLAPGAGAPPATRLEPVRVTQPVQPKPITLQPQPVLRR